MNAADLQIVFKNFGKLIFLYKLTPVWVTSLKQADMAFVDQAISGSATEFDLFQNICVPMGTVVKNLTDSLSKTPAQVQSICDSYLRKFVSTAVGLTTTDTAATVAAALVTQMNANGQTVSAFDADSKTGFGAYFRDVYGVTLPSSETPTIPDTYITDAVVA